MSTVSKRTHYNYYDGKGKTFKGYIDLEMEEDCEWINENDLQKFVKRQWKDLNYENGVIESVQLLKITP